MTLPANFRDKHLHGAGVYSITCTPTGKVYVGSAVDMFTRWRQHYYHLSLNSHHCQHLQRAWSKYGHEAFAFTVVEFADLSALRTREQAAIDLVEARYRFNSTPTAGSLLGFKMGPESLERMRIAHTGFRHSEETKARARIDRAGIASRPGGWNWSEEAKENLRVHRTGKPLSPEHKAKSIATLTKYRSVGHGPRSESHKRNHAESRRTLTDLQVVSARTQYLSGESLAQIARTLGRSETAISNAVRGVGIYGNIGTPVTVKIKHSLSEDHKKQISAVHKGRPKSAETRERMRTAWDRRKMHGPKSASTRA